MKKELTCRHPALKNEMSLEGFGVNFLALLQALQFVVDHRKMFQEEYDCPDCFEYIKYSREYISDMIQTAIEHYKIHTN